MPTGTRPPGCEFQGWSSCLVPWTSCPGASPAKAVARSVAPRMECVHPVLRRRQHEAHTVHLRNPSSVPFPTTPGSLKNLLFGLNHLLICFSHQPQEGLDVRTVPGQAWVPVLVFRAGAAAGVGRSQGPQCIYYSSSCKQPLTSQTSFCL